MTPEIFEVVRLLMIQVREEQSAREALVRALVREEVRPVPIPDDTEVNERIEALLEVARKNLTEHTKGSKL